MRETGHKWGVNLSFWVVTCSGDRNGFDISCLFSIFQTPNGNVEAKVMCFFRRRDISSSLTLLADKHQSKFVYVFNHVFCRVPGGDSSFRELVTQVKDTSQNSVVMVEITLLRRKHNKCTWILYYKRK